MFALRLLILCLCVFRDVVASTWRGVVRRGQAAAGAIRYALELQANQLALLEEAGAPALLVSYEKAIDDPLQLAASLNQFMGLGFSRKELKEHAKRVDAQMGYKASRCEFDVCLVSFGILRFSGQIF